jgi:hypothetical protein
MVRLVGGCVGRLVVLALTAAVLAVSWYNRHELVNAVDRLLDRDLEVSAEVADRAAARLAGLGRDGVTRVAFRAPELQSLIQYRWAPFLPEELASPRVSLGAGRITLEGDVSTAHFGRIAELQEILSFLPDTAGLRAAASFVPLDDGWVALEVHELGAAGIPIPKQLIPPILARFRAHTPPGLGPNAVAVPLPPVVSHIFVSGDSLVVVARGSGGG